MKRAILAVAASFLVISLAACGGDDDGKKAAGTSTTGKTPPQGTKSIDNQAACERWASSISCGQFDPQQTIPCSGYAQQTGCDLSGYFDCLTENFKCSDFGGMKTPDASGWTKCTSLATCQ